MKTREFYFDLPDELVAQHPAERRGLSRLMRLERTSGRVSHHHIADLPELLPPDSVVVLNDTRVRKARIYGSAVDAAGTGSGSVAKTAGDSRNTPPGSQDNSRTPTASVEFLLVERRDDLHWRAMVGRARRQTPGRRYEFPGGLFGRIVSGAGAYRDIEFSAPVTEDYLEEHGHVPLPPYIHRPDEPGDSERYQTVYAARPGSVAAPTAGLHLTPEILDAMTARGVDIVHVTLHVGLGTFLPVRSEDIEDHEMHSEEYEISADAADRITAAKAGGRPVVAVGTTSVRTLESAWNGTSMAAGRSSTAIFIYPGYAFRVVDALLTNFHTPESTLLMLVSAFAGKEKILAAYRQAVDAKYRFFSYGDAMFIG